jgi:O-antigen ligase
MASVVFAIDSNTSVVKVRTLVLLFVLMTSMINYIDKLNKLEKLMKYFAYSGFITSVYVILNSDFTNITRFGSELGNVNAIGMILGISSVFCFYFILENKDYKFIPMLLINTIVIFLTGSRKSLLFLVFTLIILIFSKREKKLRNNIKVFMWSAIFVLIILYAIYNVPMFYQIIGRRMENMLNFVFGEGTKEGSMNTRFMMIQMGWDWFKEHPFIGCGIDSYRILLGQEIGTITYSHNNIIELLVGIGMFGTITYYLTHIVVIKDLYKCSKVLPKPLTYSFIAIILGYMFMSVGLVYYDNKHISIILSVASIVYRIGEKEINTLN